MREVERGEKGGSERIVRGLVIEARSGVSRKKCGVLGRGGAGTVRAAFGCADGNQRVVLGGFPYTRRVATSNANAGSMGQRAPCAANEAVPRGPSGARACPRKRLVDMCAHVWVPI